MTRIRQMRWLLYGAVLLSALGAGVSPHEWLRRADLVSLGFTLYGLLDFERRALQERRRMHDLGQALWPHIACAWIVLATTEAPAGVRLQMARAVLPSHLCIHHTETIEL